MDSKQLALVAQAVSPADFDFFTPSETIRHSDDYPINRLAKNDRPSYAGR
jgi:hypothetical protein